MFCVSAGSWQVLGGSWLFLAVLGPLSSKTESQRAKQMKLGGAKRDPKPMEMRSWVFQEASGAPGGSRSAKMERHDNVWVTFWLHFGVPFSPFRSLGLLSAGRFGQKGDLEGV